MHARVTIPLPVKNVFTYVVPEELRSQAELGKRVLVEFGKSKLYAGIITQLLEKKDTEFQLKNILEILDDSPILLDWQINFFEWMANYYMCTLGEVIAAALPSSLQLKSESPCGKPRGILQRFLVKAGICNIFKSLCYA